MIVPFAHVLALAAALFVLGLACTVMRRQLVMILIGVEVMLNAAALVMVGASAYWRHADGQILVLLLMAVTASEVAVALAMVFYLRHQKGTIDADRFDRMSG